MGSNRQTVRVELPRALYQAIIRLQGNEDLDFEPACLKAALLLDPKRDEYKKAVLDEANRLAKSRFMTQLNTARKTIESQSYWLGHSAAKQQHAQIHYPCSKCKKEMTWDLSQEDHRKSIMGILEKGGQLLSFQLLKICFRNFL